MVQSGCGRKRYAHRKTVVASTGHSLVMRSIDYSPFKTSRQIRRDESRPHARPPEPGVSRSSRSWNVHSLLKSRRWMPERIEQRSSTSMRALPSRGLDFE